MLQCSIIVIVIWVQGIVAHRSSLAFALFNLLFTFVLNWSVHESEIMILEHARNYYFLFDYPVVRTQRHSTMFQLHIVHRYRCKMHQLFIFICSSHKCGIHERRTEQINGKTRLSVQIITKFTFAGARRSVSHRTQLHHFQCKR